MPVDDVTLANYYYIGVVAYLCDYGATPYTDTDPDTEWSWAFRLQDDGTGPIYPNPYIKAWDIKSHAQPSSDQLMADLTQDILDACQMALYPTFISNAGPGPAVRAGAV